jgi:hypothetical protein
MDAGKETADEILRQVPDRVEGLEEEQAVLLLLHRRRNGIKDIHSLAVWSQPYF